MFSVPMGIFSDSYDPTINDDDDDDDDGRKDRCVIKSMAEERAAAASNSHKEAERRRRKRINGHIATLKSVLPNAIKTDKASLLGEAVRTLKELKQATSTTAEFMFPTEIDELKVSCLHAHHHHMNNSGGNNPFQVKATLCCQDRPELVVELIGALKAGAEAEAEAAQVVRAEMSTVEGRTKMVVWVNYHSINNGSDGGIMLVERVRRELKRVVDKPSLPASVAASPQPTTAKRSRYCHHLPL